MSDFNLSHKYLMWVALVISITVIAVHNISIYPWMLDDAFISFRYAENLSSGYGPVFNPDERVEGYTNFLWVILLALGKTIGVDIVSFSRLLGSIFAIGCIFLLINAHKFIRSIDYKTSAVAALFLGSCGMFTAWATSGMEVTMFTFFVLLSILLYISTKQAGEIWWLLCLVSFVCIISALIRPEGVMVFGIIFLDQLIASIRNNNHNFLYLLTPFIIIYFPYSIWRYLYYGYLLPNTFYAKVGSTVSQIHRGAEYLTEFAAPALFLLFPALISMFLPKWHRRYSKSYLLVLVTVVYTLYIIAVGGDSMPAFRFFTPLIPLFCLISAMLILLLARTNKQIIFMIAAIVLYNLIQMRTNREIYSRLKNDKVVFYGKEVGLWLKENVPPNSVIATNTAGSIPYFSKLKTIDMLGMNDEHIAHRKIPSLGKGWAGHEKGDGAYVLSIRPDYIQLGSKLGSKHPSKRFLSDNEIYKSPMFLRMYTFEKYRLNSGDYLNIYKKK
jgi:hypothetical protein